MIWGISIKLLLHGCTKFVNSSYNSRVRERSNGVERARASLMFLQCYSSLYQYQKMVTFFEFYGGPSLVLITPFYHM